MRCSRNVFSARAILDREGSRSNHLSCVRANDVHSKNPIGLLLHEELHDTLRVKVGLRTRIGKERELSDAVLDTGLLEFLLVLSYPGNLRMGVYDRWNCSVVDVSVTGLEVFSNSDAYDRGEY